jgi:4-aminobutyrate aminotransferase-like enzyme
MTVPTASTFGGNPVCMAAARETMRVMDEDAIADAAAERGRQFSRALEDAASAWPGVLLPPRGQGLMLGVPVAGGAAMAGELLAALRRRGVIAGRCGPRRDVLLLEPPLTITQEEVDLACRAILAAASEVSP